MQGIVASEKWEFRHTLAARAQLQDASFFRLFTNDVDPTSPDTNPGLFVEATFDTYYVADLHASWGLVEYAEPGSYLVQCTPINYPSPATVGNTLRGWWIDDGTYILLAYKFPAPIPFPVGAAPISFRVRVQNWARVVL